MCKLRAKYNITKFGKLSVKRKTPIISLIVLLNFTITPSCNDNSKPSPTDPYYSETTTNAASHGKTVFRTKCASCHAIFKNMTGPALNRVTEVRDCAWIFEFLTIRKMIKEDSISKSFKKEFEDIECMKFPDLTREEVGNLLQYIKQVQNPIY